MTNEDLTRLYNEANGIPEGKAPPITTERIFTAMRAVQVATLRQAATWCDSGYAPDRLIAEADRLERGAA